MDSKTTVLPKPLQRVIQIDLWKIMAILLFLLTTCLYYSALSWSAPVIPQIYGSSYGSPPSWSFDPLQFDSDGNFQLSIFEDLHFGENAWSFGPAQDENSVKVLNEILDSESSTSLVVLNGDLITGENTFLQNSSTYVDEIVAPILARNLTWASTYGNHDSDFNLSREAIFEREHQWPNARTQQMVPGELAGVSNYFLPVFEEGCINFACVPKLILWFFDSRGGFYYQQKNADGSRVGQPDWVDQSVVDWFTETSARISYEHGNVTIPSLAFVHIPTYASYAAQQAGINNSTEPGINDDNPLAPQAQGYCSDGVNNNTCSYGGQDVPFMSALASLPGLMAVFSGHDHGDTWCYPWHNLPNVPVDGHGINLCFGQHSGYGGYGNWIRGARQVKANLDALKNFEVETYIRLESAEIVGHVTLNSTYGSDPYPVTPNEHTYCPDCDYN